MRWLKKSGGAVPWPWTEALASRKDMMEISEDEAHSLLRIDSAQPEAEHAPVNGSGDEAITADAIRAMTEKDALVEFAEGFGIVVDRRRSVKTMQDDLIQALGLLS